MQRNLESHLIQPFHLTNEKAGTEYEVIGAGPQWPFSLNGVGTGVRQVMVYDDLGNE